MFALPAPTPTAQRQRPQALLVARLCTAGTPLGQNLSADLRLPEQKQVGVSMPQNEESPTLQRGLQHNGIEQVQTTCSYQTPQI